MRVISLLFIGLIFVVGCDGHSRMEKPESVEVKRELTSEEIQEVFEIVQNATTREEIQQLIESGVVIDVTNKRGDTLLVYAILTNRNEKVVQALIEAGNNVNSLSNDYWPPIILAARNPHSEVIKLLLDAGADPLVKTDYGMTVLMRAVTNPSISVDTLKLLVEKGNDINAKDNNSDTPLIYAVHPGMRNNEAIKWLIEEGVEVNVQGGSFGITPLMTLVEHATYEEAKTTVKMLVEAGANVNAKDNKGITVLMYAARNKLPENAPVLIDYLIKKGANIHARDNEGRTVLMWNQAVGGSPKIYQRLIKHGADPNAKDNEGFTAEDYGLDRDHDC